MTDPEYSRLERLLARLGSDEARVHILNMLICYPSTPVRLPDRLYAKAARWYRSTGDHYVLGRYAVKLGNQAGADRIFREGLADLKKRKKFRQAAVVAHELRDLEQAADLYKRGGEYDSAAYTLEELGRINEAKKMYRKAAATAKKQGGLNVAGGHMARAGDVDAAMRLYERGGSFGLASEVARQAGRKRTVQLYDELEALTERLEERQHRAPVPALGRAGSRRRKRPPKPA